MPKQTDERRRAQRTEVRDSFNLFLVVPELFGMSRIYLRDISAVGLCFRAEVETAVRVGQRLEARVYLNPAFYLPVSGEVVRAGRGEIALDFVDAKAGAARAIAKLQEFFEAAEASGVAVEA